MDHLEFALDRADVQRVDTGQGGLGAHDLERARVEHDARRSFVHRSCLRDHQRHQHDGNQTGTDDQSLATVEEAQPLPQFVGTFDRPDGRRANRVTGRGNAV